MATTERLKYIKSEVDKASKILAAINSINLTSAKFMNRRDKIVNELNSFSQAIRRQIIPSKIRAKKIESLEAEIARLKKEDG